ncbi:MAG: helix-turn-helix domain-containing protein [Fibrobacterota bacterium]
MDPNKSSETTDPAHAPSRPNDSVAPLNAAAVARILEAETLGEHLRKIRIGGRIDIHKMAQDTKLTLEYLQAIEKNEFGKIPGETYRKIFLKNVAKYLGLVPDAIYARYLSESGQAAEPESVPADAPVSNAPLTPAEPPHPPENSTRTLLIVLGALLGVFLLIMLTQGGKNSGDEKAAEHAADTEQDLSGNFQRVQDSTAVPTPSIEATPPAAPPAPAIKNSPDTVAAPEIVRAPATAAETDTPASDNRGQNDRFRPETQGALKVELACVRDSIWVFTYRNKKTWNNLFKAGEAKVFASDSAIYFRLSAPDRVTFKLNGRELPPGRPASAKNNTLRIDFNGLSYITKQEWNALLKRR